MPPVTGLCAWPAYGQGRTAASMSGSILAGLSAGAYPLDRRAIFADQELGEIPFYRFEYRGFREGHPSNIHIMDEHPIRSP